MRGRKTVRRTFPRSLLLLPLCAADVTLRLGREKGVIFPLFRHERLMIAHFDDLAVFQHDDLIRHRGTGQTVRNKDRYLVPVPPQPVKLVEDLLLQIGRASCRERV